MCPAHEVAFEVRADSLRASVPRPSEKYLTKGPFWRSGRLSAYWNFRLRRAQTHSSGSLAGMGSPALRSLELILDSVLEPD